MVVAFLHVLGGGARGVRFRDAPLEGEDSPHYGSRQNRVSDTHGWAESTPVMLGSARRIDNAKLSVGRPPSGPRVEMFAEPY